MQHVNNVHFSDAIEAFEFFHSDHTYKFAVSIDNEDRNIGSEYLLSNRIEDLFEQLASWSEINVIRDAGEEFDEWFIENRPIFTNEAIDFCDPIPVEGTSKQEAKRSFHSVFLSSWKRGIFDIVGYTLFDLNGQSIISFLKDCLDIEFIKLINCDTDKHKRYLLIKKYKDYVSHDVLSEAILTYFRHDDIHKLSEIGCEFYTENNYHVLLRKMRSNLRLAKKFIQNGISPYEGYYSGIFEGDEESNPYRMTTLHSAASGDFDAFGRHRFFEDDFVCEVNFYKMMNLDLNITDINGETALHYVAKHVGGVDVSLEKYRMLVSLGFNESLRSKKHQDQKYGGMTPKEIATCRSAEAL